MCQCQTSVSLVPTGQILDLSCGQCETCVVQLHNLYYIHGSYGVEKLNSRTVAAQSEARGGSDGLGCDIMEFPIVLDGRFTD